MPKWLSRRRQRRVDPVRRTRWIKPVQRGNKFRPCLVILRRLHSRAVRPRHGRSHAMHCMFARHGHRLRTNVVHSVCRRPHGPGFGPFHCLHRMCRGADQLRGSHHLHKLPRRHGRPYWSRCQRCVHWLCGRSALCCSIHVVHRLRRWSVQRHRACFAMPSVRARPVFCRGGYFVHRVRCWDK